MKSATLPSFWEKYNSLDSRVKEQPRKAYRFWLENPFHRSLHFKCINQEENIWSARITRGYRVIRPGRVFEMVGFRQLLLANPPLHRLESCLFHR